MRVVPLEAFRDRIPFAAAVQAVERGFRTLVQSAIEVLGL